MKKMFSLVVVILLMLVTFNMSQARFKRVNQLPNGSKFDCANCHIDPNGGGARNLFGQVVQGSFLDGNGDVTWNVTLAGLDSDNDGVNNGAELQDANGSWSVGQSQPGDVNLVSNPGDAGSTTAVVDLSFASIPNEFNLSQNYPNPFNPETEIRFNLPKSSFVTLEVYNSIGQQIRILVSEQLNTGQYTINWNGKNKFGDMMNSGIYYYRLKTEQFSDLKHMILLK